MKGREGTESGTRGRETGGGRQVAEGQPGAHAQGTATDGYKQSVGVGHWPPKSQPGSRSFSLAPVWIIEKSERPGDQVGGCHDLVISNVSVGR